MMNRGPRTRNRPADPSRRRSLTVLAGVACLPLAGTRSTAAGSWRWRGSALGAEAELLFAGAPAAAARVASEACMAEVARLEAIFSLWRGDSELARLNADGVLADPSLDMRELLAKALELASASQGAFDPTVQPLWQLYADLGAAGRLDPDGPPPHRLNRVRRVLGWRGVNLAGGRISLARPGMAVTLNGIAQGYITDRITALLRRHGFRHVLVQLGETCALGRPDDGDAWNVAVEVPGHPATSTVWRLRDRALATSAGAASPFDTGGRFHHLLDPHSGKSAHRFAGVTVEHDDATIADGLSTALSLLPVARGRVLLSRFGGQARYVFADGAVREV